MAMFVASVVDQTAKLDIILPLKASAAFAASSVPKSIKQYCVFHEKQC
jgi:hypothetical protein